MEHLYIDSARLESYKDFLAQQRALLVGHALSMREMLTRFRWDDHLFDQIKHEVWNVHFRNVNQLASTLQQTVDELNEILALTKEYFESV